MNPEAHRGLPGHRDRQRHRHIETEICTDTDRDTQSNATVLEVEGQCSGERNGGRRRDIEREV